MKPSKKIESEEELKKRLTPQQYHVLRERGTEPPFTGEYYDNKKTGVYSCRVCGNRLFESNKKYDSGSGWPSFFDVTADVVELREDRSHGMVRTEVVCRHCGSHLGHLFDDGPKPTGKRYCINSVSLDFEEDKSNPHETQTAAFGAGCFWGIQEAFSKIPGVIGTAAGYMGGHTENPDYRAVCTDATGHAEVVMVEYDPTKVSYRELLDVFWKIHDPTQLNRQGPDSGTQYRSVVFYFTEEQKKEATASRDEAQKNLSKKIVTEIIAAPAFWRAEDYHQHYYRKRGIKGCRID